MTFLSTAAPGLMAVAAAGESVLAQSITSDMLQGVLNEMLAMLPIVMPVAITYIGIRKGLNFVLGFLHSA